MFYYAHVAVALLSSIIKRQRTTWFSSTNKCAAAYLSWCRNIQQTVLVEPLAFGPGQNVIQSGPIQRFSLYLNAKARLLVCIFFPATPQLLPPCMDKH